RAVPPHCSGAGRGRGAGTGGGRPEVPRQHLRERGHRFGPLGRARHRRERRARLRRGPALRADLHDPRRVRGRGVGGHREGPGALMTVAPSSPEARELVRDAFSADTMAAETTAADTTTVDPATVDPATVDPAKAWALLTELGLDAIGLRGPDGVPSGTLAD